MVDLAKLFWIGQLLHVQVKKDQTLQLTVLSAKDAMRRNGEGVEAKSRSSQKQQLRKRSLWLLWLLQLVISIHLATVLNSLTSLQLVILLSINTWWPSNKEWPWCKHTVIKVSRHLWAIQCISSLVRTIMSWDLQVPSCSIHFTKDILMRKLGRIQVNLQTSQTKPCINSQLLRQVTPKCKLDQTLWLQQTTCLRLQQDIKLILKMEHKPHCREHKNARSHHKSWCRTLRVKSCYHRSCSEQVSTMERPLTSTSCSSMAWWWDHRPHIHQQWAMPFTNLKIQELLDHNCPSQSLEEARSVLVLRKETKITMLTLNNIKMLTWLKRHLILSTRCLKIHHIWELIRRSESEAVYVKSFILLRIISSRNWHNKSTCTSSSCIRSFYLMRNSMVTKV